jgi:hypothetical protein
MLEITWFIILSAVGCLVVWGVFSTTELPSGLDFTAMLCVWQFSFFGAFFAIYNIIIMPLFNFFLTVLPERGTALNHLTAEILILLGCVCYEIGLSFITIQIHDKLTTPKQINE